MYGAGMWLEVGKTVDCMVEAVCKMWLEVGETEDSMVEAVHKEPGCG